MAINSRQTAVEFFRKYSDFIVEAEQNSERDTLMKILSRMGSDEQYALGFKNTARCPDLTPSMRAWIKKWKNSAWVREEGIYPTDDLSYAARKALQSLKAGDHSFDNAAAVRDSRGMIGGGVR